MNNNHPGTISHMERFNQKLLFDGMQYDRKITPTDFDGVVEYKNVAWIITEVKYADTDLPYGQELAINRFVDDMYRAGKTVLAIIAEHNISNPSEPVHVRECIVRQYKMDYGDWERLENITVGQLIDKFTKRIDEKLAVRNTTSQIFRTEKEKDKL